MSIQYFEWCIHHNWNIKCWFIMTPSGEDKKSHYLFSFLAKIVLYLHFISGICQKYYYIILLASFKWLHLLWKLYQSKKPKSYHGIRHAHKFCLHTDVSCDTQCSPALNMQLPCVIDEHNSHLSFSNGWE